MKRKSVSGNNKFSRFGLRRNSVRIVKSDYRGGRRQ